MARDRDTMFFGHPIGLATLFFTELWERFSYYGMRALLVLFMTAAVADGGFGMDEKTALAIYGLYTAGVYMVALPGGWIADRLLGQRHAVLIGGIIIAVGHFTLAIPGNIAFYTGLVLVVLGTGLLKPNVSAIVGDIYPEGGARRDAGFSIFYMGINIGAFAGPLVCGGLGEKVDWHLGFAAAGVGMVLGLVVYVYGLRFLGDAGLLRGGENRRQPLRMLFIGITAALVLVAALGWLRISERVTWSIVDVAAATGVVIAAVAAIYFVSVIVFAGLSTVEKKRVGLIAILFLAVAIFWAGFEQAGSSMNLFAKQLTDRQIAGWEMPASWFQSVNAIFIIILAPVMGGLWIWLGSRNPSLGSKFALGLGLMAVGFLVMAWGASFASEDGGVSPMWLVVTYFFHTVGELCVSPVGLSSVTKLAPKQLVGQMMGMWFMGAALGNLIAGLLASYMTGLSMPTLFITVAAMGGGGALLLFVLVVARVTDNLAGGVK